MFLERCSTSADGSTDVAGFRRAPLIPASGSLVPEAWTGAATSRPLTPPPLPHPRRRRVRRRLHALSQRAGGPKNTPRSGLGRDSIPAEREKYSGSWVNTWWTCGDKWCSFQDPAENGYVRAHPDSHAKRIIQDHRHTSALLPGMSKRLRLLLSEALQKWVYAYTPHLHGCKSYKRDGYVTPVPSHVGELPRDRQCAGENSLVKLLVF